MTYTMTKKNNMVYLFHCINNDKALMTYTMTKKNNMVYLFFIVSIIINTVILSRQWK